MPVLYQKIISRQDVQANRYCFYLFGDNELGVGYAGQAGAMRGEPNAIGIPTKKTAQRYLNDNDDLPRLSKKYEDLFEEIIELLERDKVIIIPYDGIGTGLAKLQEKAPQIYNCLQTHLKNLKKWYHD